MTDAKQAGCYWWEEAPPQATEKAGWPAHTEIAIIGCGFAGLSAAITLARAGRQVAIFEKEAIGFGASTRNGGITSGNIRYSHAQLSKRFGPDRAIAFMDEAVAARATLYRFIEDENIECDFQPNGRLVGISKPFDADALLAENTAFARRYGITPLLVQGEELHSYIGSAAYQAGLYRPDIAGIHPAKLLHEKLRLARAAGVIIHAHCPVLRLERTGAGFVLETAHGKVQADHLISATNGYTDTAQAWLRRRLVPVISEIIVTENLGSNFINSLMPKRTMFGEDKEVGFYYRSTPDGQRILLGGRRMHAKDAIAQTRLHKGLASIFPELASARIDHYWAGNVVFPFDQMPKLAVHDGIIYPTGFCGSGTVWAHWLGRKAALMILGAEADENTSNQHAAATNFAGLPMHTLPFYTGDPWFMPLAMSYYRLRDKLAGGRY